MTLYQVLLVGLFLARDVLSVCPNVSEDFLIKKIITQVPFEHQWDFGCALHIPLNDLKVIQGWKRDNSSMSMFDIFDCWNKKIVDPNKRSWRCVLHALDTVGYKALAIEIEKDLTRS